MFYKYFRKLNYNDIDELTPLTGRETPYKVQMEIAEVRIEGFKGRTGDVTFAKLWTSLVLPKYGQDISGFSMG